MKVWQKKYNKYSNRRKSPCNQSHLHDSQGEAKYCNELALLKKIGEIADYRIQERFDYIVNGKKICFHKVDFLVFTNDDTIEVHEYKGKKTAGWILKMKLFKALFPHIEYKIIKG